MITDIRLQRFRSYRDESFEFDPGVNIVVGPNASGKTNLLEAVLVVSRGGSFRAKDAELLAFGAPWGRIDAHGPEGGRIVKLLPQENGGIKKEYEISDHKLKRLSVNKQLPSVLFEPNHLMLLRGSPDLRREHMDDLLTQAVAGYSGLLRDYKRAVAQRNALLKHGQSGAPQLFAWNIRLGEMGGQIAKNRLELIDSMNKKLGSIYKMLVGKKAPKVALKYQTVCQPEEYASSLLKQLEARQASDIERGYTSVGPHRDDFIVTFDGRPASEVASRGETRTTLLALKVLELEIVEESRQQKPLLLLDDVFSELDGARRRALTEVIKGYQTFITTTDADVVVQHFMDRCNIIPL